MFAFKYFAKVLLIAAVISVACAAQTPAPPPVAGLQAPPAPTLTVTSREVLLDVVVTDAESRPVTGLTAADFTITEEGQPQTIRHLEEHASLNAADVSKLQSAPPLPPNTFTNYTPVANSNAFTVILLDALDTPVTAQMYLRDQIIAYLKHMQPGTPIAIFQLDTQMRLIQGFSTDPQVLLAAAQSKRNMPSLRGRLIGSPGYIIRMKNEILGQGLQSIGRYLASFPGRKNLIWFTGAVPTWLSGSPSVEEVERRSGNPFRDSFSVYDDALAGLTDALSLSRVAIYPIDARGLQTLPAFDASRRRPGGNMAFNTFQAFNQLNLEEMGEATGGKAYFNTNGLKNVLAEIVNNGSNYYTLAYATTNQKWQGEFRRIKITVNRPGVKLQYRPGYYAIDRTQLEQRQLAVMQYHIDRGQQPPTIPPGTASSAPSVDDKGALIQRPRGGFDAAMALGAIPPTEIVFTAALAIDNSVTRLGKSDTLPRDNFLKDDFKTKPFHNFNVAIHTDAHSLNITQSPDGKRHGSLLFVTALYTPEGEMINSIQTSVSFDLGNESYRKLLHDGLPVKQQIAVPVKGNYFLRIGIHDLGNDRVGAVEIPVDQVHPNITPQMLAER